MSSVQERDGSFTVNATVSHQAGEERESHTIHRDSSKANLPSPGESPILRQPGWALIAAPPYLLCSASAGCEVSRPHSAGSRKTLGEKESRRVKLFCQIVDNSGKLLTRRSLSIRRSSSLPWQASQNLDTEAAKPSPAAPGILGLTAATQERVRA